MSETHSPPITAASRESRIARRTLWTILGGMLLLLFTLGATAWGLAHRHKVREDRLTALFPFGGAVELEFAPYADPPPARTTPASSTWQSGIAFRDAPSPRMRWLVERFGACAFAHVRHVKILSNRFDDNDVPHLLAVPDVHELDVSHTALTDGGVARLASLRHLVKLRLEGVKLAPETLRLFANCRELRELDLTGTGVDAETVSYLERILPGCKIER